MLGASKADAFLRSVAAQELADLLENPQTLELIAIVITNTGGGTMPTSRAGLFEKACPLLLREMNTLHVGRRPMKAEEQLLDDCGAIFAHLLLSGMAGIALVSNADPAAGFVSEAELADLALNAETYVLKTRLFRSEGENLLRPVHRMIAEYLGARWLAKRLTSSLPEQLSERRLFQSISGVSGVPSALRGLNAWLAHHCPSVAGRCIAADPYGVFRYGDIAAIPISEIRKLLAGLGRLSDENPYFRRADLSPRTSRALARIELKDDILALLAQKGTNTDLATLLLESMRDSALAPEIVPELWGIACCPDISYASRRRALNAVLTETASVDLDANIRKLIESSEDAGPQLALDAIVMLKGKSVTSGTIADAMISHHGLDSGRKGLPPGVDFDLPEVLAISQIDGVLRLIAERLDGAHSDPTWQPSASLIVSSIRLLASQLSSSTITPATSCIWQLLRSTTRMKLPDHERRVLSSFFTTRDSARREVQRRVITEAFNQRYGFQRLGRFRIGLEMTPADTVPYLQKIANKPALTEEDRAFWQDLIDVHEYAAEIPIVVRQAVQCGLTAHPELMQSPLRESQEALRGYESELALRRIAYEDEKAKSWSEWLADLENRVPGISSGQDLEALESLASIYLGWHPDLPASENRAEKFEERLDIGLATAAKDGFLALIARAGLPTVREIAELKVRNQPFSVEGPMVCAVVEELRRGMGLSSISTQTLKAVLAICCHGHPWPSRIFGIDLQAELERFLLRTAEDRRTFLVDSIEPFLLAGHEDIPRFLDLANTISTPQQGGELALRWLRDFPLQRRVLEYLLETALKCAPKPELSQLVREKFDRLNAMAQDARRLWASAGFILKIQNWQAVVAAEAQADPGLIWILRRLMMLPDGGSGNRKPTIVELHFIVREFSQAWPLTGMTAGVHGMEEPWDASRFIMGSIEAIGQDLNDEAGKLLDDLLSRAGTESYRDLIKHARARHQQALNDKTFIMPDFQQVKQMLAGGAPGTIDDLKALTIDHLAKIQEYARDSDTDNWRTYWAGREPLVEEIRQDRLLDDLRNRMGHFGLHMNPTELDNESKERALVGEVTTFVSLAGQICREFSVSDHGIDMEIEFKNDANQPTGKKLYLQLKSGASYLKERISDGAEIFRIKDERHFTYWKEQAFHVMLVIRGPRGEIRWMEIRDLLRRESAAGKAIKQFEFEGESFDVPSIRRWRDRLLGSEIVD